MGINHGLAGLAAAYGIALVGLAVGLIAARAEARRGLIAPVLALPVAVGITLLWTALLQVLPGLPAALGSRGTAVAGGLMLLLGGVAAAALGPAGRGRPGLIRGARVEAPTAGVRRSTSSAELLLAGQPVPPGDEAKHFKLIGTTGTGKSTAIRALLGGALARGDRAVIADPDGAYLRDLWDASRGDRILNPFHSRSTRWDLFGELRDAHDGDLLARALIPDGGGDDRAWRGYARVFLSATLRQLARAGCDDVATLYRLLATAPVEELRELLSSTPAGPYLAEDNARFFASVRAIANAQLAPLEYLDRPANSPQLSVRAWTREVSAGGGVLFLPYRASQIAILRGLVSTWMRLAVFETMELGEADHRLWFVVDELDALGAIDGLKDALARLRKYGGRCVLGFQSIAQVAGTYGAADAQTIVENCGNTLILRCSAAENGGTARFASRLIGEREIVREVRSRSQNGLFEKPSRSRTVSLQHATESAVLAAEIEQLADLHGYVKFASRPEWLRVTVPV